MKIRKALLSDLDKIMNIYKIAKEYMWENGNKMQWNSNYPSKEIIKNDIDNKVCYVFELDDDIHAVFSFIIGEDDTYRFIYNGSWISDSIYGTIHRIASDGKIKGIFSMCIKFCKKEISHLRIDTHLDNKIMQYLIEKNGFIKCGTIYVKDGTSRIAYEYYEK